MLQLMAGFAALSMISSLLTNLMPEGSLRHAASMAIGLVMLLFWAQGLQDIWADLPTLPRVPSTVLTASGVSLPDTEAALMQEAAP